MTFWNWSALAVARQRAVEFRWSVAAADAQGSFNLPGAKVAGHDALIAALCRAQPDRIRHRGARLRSAVDIRLLGRSALSPAAGLAGALDPNRATSVTSASGPVTGAWWAKPGEPRRDRCARTEEHGASRNRRLGARHADQVLRKNAATPDRLALADFADRSDWTRGEPERLTMRRSTGASRRWPPSSRASA
jgi:hypothetical protein